MAYRKDWSQPLPGPEGTERTGKVYGRTVTIQTTDNVTGNTVGAFQVNGSFVVTNIIAVASDMDSGTSMTISVGDAASGTRYLNASNIGQTGATTTTVASTGLLFKTTGRTEILVTITAQGTTSGTIALYLLGFLDN